MITRMDHFTIVTDRLDVTRRFYTELLEMEEGPRPPFPVPGCWLYISQQPVLHVISVKEMPEPRRGVLDHMAFRAEGLMRTLNRLDAAGVSYRIIRAPGELRTWQVFFMDPNGVEVELDFDPAESAPDDWALRRRPI
jgi:catechol 2,3-dioxygenase-like lactoylglutathione lyase family enzyme